MYFDRGNYYDFTSLGKYYMRFILSFFELHTLQGKNIMGLQGEAN